MVKAEPQNRLGELSNILRPYPRPNRLKFSSLGSSRSDGPGLASTNVVLLHLSPEKRKLRLRGMDLEKDLVLSEAETLSSCLMFSRREEFALRFLWVGVSECSGKHVPSGLGYISYLNTRMPACCILGTRCGDSRGLWSWDLSIHRGEEIYKQRFP